MSSQMTADQLMNPDVTKPVGDKKSKPYNHLIIDGGGMVVTAWSTQRNLEYPEDRVRGAVFVFVTALASLSQLIVPGSKIIVAWDGKDNRKWRRGRHPWYKHGRGSVINRQEVAAVVSLLNSLMSALGIGVIQIDGREADDVVASLASRIINEDTSAEVLIFSDDKDYYQLVCDRIHLCRRSMDGIILTPNQASVMNITVGEKYLHVKAVYGDTGDNIKGLKQIGEAKAFSLLDRNPDFVRQCKDDPASADWSRIDGALRAAFVRAGRRLVSPPDLHDPDFVKAFCKKHGIKVPAVIEVEEDACLLAAAMEIQWALDLVTMDYSIEDNPVFSKPELHKIPRILQDLDLGTETDLYSSLYRLAGVSTPGEKPSWRAAVRAGARIQEDGLADSYAQDKF